MHLKITKKGQSILEYAILLGIIISAVLIMQTFVKRGFQGGLKESADRMGEQFSASGTSTHRKRTMTADQVITEETGTTIDTSMGIGAYVKDRTLEGTADHGAYSLSQRSGGDSTIVGESKTSAATQEKFKWADYATDDSGSYNMGSH